MAMQPANLDDGSLSLLKQRDPTAVARWFGQYADAVYAFAWRRVSRNPDLAADVVQETFLRALNGIDGYDPARGAMLTWLLLIARNCVADAWRHRRRHETGNDAWEQIDAGLLEACRHLQTQPLPEDVVASQEMADLVRIAMAGIPADYREVLDGRYYRQDSLAQMALRRGCTEGAIKSLLHRARLALKDALLAVTQTLQDAARRKG